MRAWKPALLILVLWIAGCTSDEETVAPVPTEPPPLSILALGDSYTVGQSVPFSSSWPAQLADSLAAQGHELQRLEVIAVTGWTTRDLLDAVRDSLATDMADSTFGLVALLIGVNNQFQGLDPELFTAELDTLLDLATALADDDPGRVLGLTIPDYGLTPAGSAFDPDRIRREIAALNDELTAQLAARGIPLVDVGLLADAAAEEPELVARDGLHYSREMYRRWVVAMLPAVRAALRLEI